MAIFKLAPPLAGIRGTIGGQVFSANKSGPYIKLWARGSNPSSGKQTTERAFVGGMPGLWAALSDPQRAAWRTFAGDPAQELTNSLGEGYYASGFNWFTKCNVRLTRVGRATIQAVPTQARPAAPTTDDFRVCVAGTESDQCVGGVASASTVWQPAFNADKAFDDNLTTAWLTMPPNTTGWLRYDLAAPRNIKHYALYPWTVITQSPRDWTFEVFASGAWQVIHTVTGHLPVVGVWDHFYCPNPYTETDYRINVTANNGFFNFLGIMEMEMYVGDVGASVICYPEDEFDAAPDYDLILHVSQGPTTERLVRYVGYLEILAQQDPNRWAATFQTEIENVAGIVQENRSWFAQFFRQTREGLRSSPQAAKTITLS